MKDFIRWIAIIPLFIIPFLPLYSEGSLFFPFIAGKAFAFRILVGIAAGAWVLLALADKRYRPKWSWTFLIYGALLVWMFIADLFAVNPHKAFWSNYERMDGFVTLAHVFVLFVVAGSVLTVNKLWKKWWLVVILAGAFSAVHGILQLLGAAQIHQSGTRLDANMGNSAYFAAYLLFIIAVTLWQAFENKGWLRYSLFVLTGIQVMLLLATATRGAMLGLVGAVFVGGLYWMFTAGKTGRRVGAGVLGALVLIVGGFFLIKDTSVIQNDPALNRFANISLADGSTRFTLWGMAMKGASERPLTGWGHEGYSYIFTKFYEPSLYAQEPWFDRAHSVYIDWLVYGGVPAFLLFIALLASGVIALMRGPYSKLERVMLISAIVAYAIQALFVFDNLMSYVLLAAILAVAHAGVSRPIKALEEARELDERTLNSVALPVVIVLTGAALWVVNVPGIAGGQALIRALGARNDVSNSIEHFKAAIDSGTFATQEVREQLISYAGQALAAPTVSNEMKTQLLAFASEEMEKEIAAAPQDARLKIMYAQALEATGNYGATLSLLEEARQLSPKKQTVLLQMGLESWKLGDTNAAHSFFTQAYELETSNKEAAMYAAAGDIITGNVEEGKALLVSAYGTTSVNHDIIRFAFVAANMFPEAVASARQRVVEENGSPDSRLYLARMYATAGRFAEARAEIAATIAAFPQAKTVGEELLKQFPGGQ